MEFKYRAIDNKPPTASFPPSSAAYVSDRSLRTQQEAYFRAGGFSGMPTNTFRVPVAVGEALQRELEKEQIRREIIAGEVARRRELEAEVRRELALERALGMPMQRCAAAPFTFQERVASWPNPILSTAVDDDMNNNIIGMSQPQLHRRIESLLEIKPSSLIDKNKVIMLPKPDLDLAKRKAVTPAVYDTEDTSERDLKKRAKVEWSCPLCQVSVTSERDLKKHLNGKKHKAKKTAKRTPMIGLHAKADRSSPQPCGTMVDKGVMESKNQDEEEKLVQNGKETEEAGKRNALKIRKVALWCKVCQIRTYSQVVMETHKKGKQHLSKMMKFPQN